MNANRVFRWCQVAALIAMLAASSCAKFPDDYDGYDTPVGLSPNNVILSAEGQSFQLTSEKYYYITRIVIDGQHYTEFPRSTSNSKTSGAIDVEWVHWTHEEGDNFSTLLIDENASGKERTAIIQVSQGDAGDRLSIIQRPKE